MSNQPALATTAAGKAISSWIREHAHPISTDASTHLDDLEPLRSIVGDAPVVGVSDVRVGEETQALGLRVLQFLVERLGFRVLALEESALAAARFDRHVQHGYGQPAALLRDHAWEPWQIAGLARTLEWVRGFNLDHPTDRVHVVGADIAREDELHPEEVIDWIAPLVPDIAPQLRARYAGLASISEPDGLASALDAARSARELIAAADSSTESETALRYATAIQGYLEYRLTERYEVIEEHFATSTVGIHEHFDARVVYWGGVAHVAAATQREIPGMSDKSRSMGSMLRERFGAGYVPIGLPFDRATGDFPVPPLHESFADAHFAQVDLDTYLLSLTGPKSGPVADWLERPSPIRVLGPGYRPENDQQHQMAGDSLANRFAAIIHTQEVTPASALP